MTTSDAMDRLVAITHELGLYDDCELCRETGGHGMEVTER